MTSATNTGMTGQGDRLPPDMGWKGLALSGAMMAIGGCPAIPDPFAASLAAEAWRGRRS